MSVDPALDRGGPPLLFVASAPDGTALHAVTAALRQELARPDASRSFAAWCATAARRDHGAARLAVVARSFTELAEQLELDAVSEASWRLSRGVRVGGRPPLAFVFSGQGPQWLGMGRQLFEQEKVFRAQVEGCEDVVHQLLGWSLIGELFAAPEASRLDAIDVLQPVIYAYQVGLAALLRSWGIEPDVVIGHSVGELAAAHVAGALSLADGARIACARSKVSLAPCTIGAMAVLGLSAEAVAPFLAAEPGRAWIAIHESPDSTVISGETAAIERIVVAATARDLFARRVNAPVAGHTPMWDSLREALLDQIAAIQPRAASLRMQSTVDLQLDARGGDGSALGPAYWWPNLRSTVLFEQALSTLVSEGVRTFLELSPHPILSRAVAQCGRHRGAAVRAIPTIQRREDERACLLAAVAALFTGGAEPRFAALQAVGSGATAEDAPAPELDALIAGALDRGRLAAPPAAVPIPAAPRADIRADLRADLRAAAAPVRAEMIEALLLRHLARILGVPSAKLAADAALADLGLDSLMALDLRNRLRADLDVAPPLARLVGSNATPRDLARELLAQVATAATTTASPPPLAAGELSDDQVRALLRELEG